MINARPIYWCHNALLLFISSILPAARDPVNLTFTLQSDLRGLTLQCGTLVNGSCVCTYLSSTPEMCTVSGEDVLGYPEIGDISYGKWAAIVICITIFYRIATALNIVGLFQRALVRPLREQQLVPIIWQEKSVKIGGGRLGPLSSIVHPISLANIRLARRTEDPLYF
ncbi:hypothetical protein B0H13DRAFT_2331249 [Mycena leptocephala]|nr:hypothetical protein B0H13DRAFT_2331249 [Mycena leptocephala]